MISRNFVEVGPFTEREIAAFKKRHVLWDSDYMRTEGTHNWETLGQWVAEGSPAKASAKKKPSSSAKRPRSKNALKKPE